MRLFKKLKQKISQKFCPRIILLIPDKLATAIEINKEMLPDPKDDGSFLIDLVLKLTAVYRDQIKVRFGKKMLHLFGITQI